MNKFYHIVEHYPAGTIYNLINELSIYPNHEVFLIKNIYDLNELSLKINFNNDSIIILHCTGRLLPAFLNFDTLFSNVKNKYLYMHVSYNYLIYKKRFEAINLLKIYNQKGIYILAPSKTVSKQYVDNGFSAQTIRPGISIKKRVSNTNVAKLQKYYGKIISCCTEDTLEYQNIKGIDKLTTIIKRNHLESMTLYVGINNKVIDGIECKKFSNSELLQILKYAKVYIQLSKFESYNITAVEAKQLKVPIILSDVEGHLESGDFGIIVKNVKDAEKELMNVIHNRNMQLKEIVNNNYCRSIFKENAQSFYEQFSKLQNNGVIT